MKRLLKIIILLVVLVIYPVKAKVLNVNDIENVYKLERSYVVDKYIFDLSKGFNPSLKDLLIAASHNTENDISVYEVKISQNINNDMVYEYRELLNNTELNAFPNIDVKYIYNNTVSNNYNYVDVDPDMNLVYGNSNAKILTEEEFNELGIDHAYAIGEYLFNLDAGFNPSLKDLLLASKTVYSDNMKIYEIKKSENISGDIIVEYNELLSNTKLNDFPIIKIKYIYENHVYNNQPDNTLAYYDIVSLNDLTKTYTSNKIVVNEATSQNNLPIVYEFYKNANCTGEKYEDGVVNVGEYGVLAKSVGNERYLEGTKCAKLTVVPKDISTISQVSLVNNSHIYTGSEIEAQFNVTENGNNLVANKDYTYTYSDNINYGTGKINIQFIGNYTGSKVKEFAISKRNIELYASDHEKVYDDILFETTKLSYCNVSNSTPLGDGDVISACNVVADSLDQGTHETIINSYEISKDGVNVNNNYNVTLTKGTITTSKRDIMCTINPKSKGYDGTKLDLYLECTNLVEGHTGTSTKTLPTIINVADSTIFSLEKTEVKVTRANNSDVTSNYSIEISNGGLIPLAILGKDGTDNNNIVVTLEYDSVVGNGEEKKPRITNIHDNELNVDLLEDESYTYTYFNNIYPGTGEVRIEFKGNYKGNRTVTFVIE